MPTCVYVCMPMGVYGWVCTGVGVPSNNMIQ